MRLYSLLSPKWSTAPPETEPAKTETQARAAPNDTEKRRKAEEERAAALDKMEWLASMIDRYAALEERIQTELDSNDRLTERQRITLEKQLLSTEEKIRKLAEERNKAYYKAHKPE